MAITPETCTIGIITALTHEYTAMKAMLSAPEPYTAPGVGAGREYLMGQISSERGGVHHVVLHLGDMGNAIAARRATRLMEHFGAVDTIFMTGIAGGVPHPEEPEHHVRLGDIVVSGERGVIQYGKVKDSGSFQEIRSAPRPPAARWLESVRLMQAAELEGRRPWEDVLTRARKQLGWKKPAQTTDRLAATHDPERIVAHPRDPRRKGARPRVFVGPIAAHDVLLKNAPRRDALRDQFKVKAVEMESSGIADATWDNERGYLVVRGICDYCDAHKGDDWQHYAALVAAAYTFALIRSTPVAMPATLAAAVAARPRQASAAPRLGATHRAAPSAHVRNPFDETRAIRQHERFVGRAQPYKRLRSLLSGGSVTLVGPPKIGKTSLMLALARDWTGPILGPIDLQGIEDNEHLYHTLARGLGQESSGWRRLHEVLREHRLLLLLDELDSGAGRCLDAEHLGRLRSVCGENPEFKLVTVSRVPLKRVFPDTGHGSPVFNLLQPLTLEPMPEPEARALLAHPWAPEAAHLDEATREEILDMVQGHPFLLQRAGYHAFEALNDPHHDWRAAWRADREHML